MKTRPAPVYVILANMVLTFYSVELAKAECADLIASGVYAYVA